MNTEAPIMKAQDQVLNTRAVAHKIYQNVQCPRCKLCEQYVEAVAHFISGCSKLAETKHTERLKNVASAVYKDICAEYNIKCSKDWWIKQKE